MGLSLSGMFEVSFSAHAPSCPRRARQSSESGGVSYIAFEFCRQRGTWHGSRLGHWASYANHEVSEPYVECVAKQALWRTVGALRSIFFARLMVPTFF